MWSHKDSNLGPPACKAGALNQLSYETILLLPFLLTWCKITGSLLIMQAKISKKYIILSIILIISYLYSKINEKI